MSELKITKPRGERDERETEEALRQRAEQNLSLMYFGYQPGGEDQLSADDPLNEQVDSILFFNQTIRPLFTEYAKTALKKKRDSGVLCKFGDDNWMQAIQEAVDSLTADKKIERFLAALPLQ